MKKLLLLAMLIASFNVDAASTSAYTDLTDSCKTIASSETDPEAEIDYFMSVCPRRDGLDIRLDGGDARSWISIVKKGTDELVAEQISLAAGPGFFPYIAGNKLEWRYTDGELTALIVRVGGQDVENYEKNLVNLAIIRIDKQNPSAACVIGAINAKNSKANENARKIADNPNLKCE